MNAYRYQITVEALAERGKPVEGRQLQFQAANHDDVLEIVERLRERLPYDAETVAQLAVGLKLFAEVGLVHRADPLFAEIRPALREFVGKLKAVGRPVE